MKQKDFMWISGIIITCYNDFTLESCLCMINTFSYTYNDNELADILANKLSAQRVSIRFSERVVCEIKKCMK